MQLLMGSSYAAEARAGNVLMSFNNQARHLSSILQLTIGSLPPLALLLNGCNFLSRSQPSSAQVSAIVHPPLVSTCVTLQLRVWLATTAAFTHVCIMQYKSSGWAWRIDTVSCGCAHCSQAAQNDVPLLTPFMGPAGAVVGPLLQQVLHVLHTRGAHHMRSWSACPAIGPVRFAESNTPGETLGVSSKCVSGRFEKTVRTVHWVVVHQHLWQSNSRTHIEVFEQLPTK